MQVGKARFHSSQKPVPLATVNPGLAVIVRTQVGRGKEGQ